METAAIILAAGAGTRMKSKKPKVVHEVLGRPLVRWVVEAAKEAGADRVVTVVGHMRDQVIPLVEGDTEVVVQEAQRGTADAVLAAADALAGFDGAVVVLSGDSPLIQPETIRQMAALREEHNAAVIVLTMELENPFGYGRIVRDGAGEVARIVEQKDASPEEAAITECNSGVYCFDACALFDALSQVCLLYTSYLCALFASACSGIIFSRRGFGAPAARLALRTEIRSGWQAGHTHLPALMRGYVSSHSQPHSLHRTFTGDVELS